MICLLHGYLLEGSGSNLWTRSIIQSLCQEGYTVHLFCQENHPELYDFISTFNYYNADGTRETRLERDTPYRGHCILHKPYIGDVLPVYVWDQYEEFNHVQPMIELENEQIESYLNHNIKVLRRIANEYNITAFHVNHAVLMSVVAQQISEELSIPFAIMPHGSAIEYAVKKDPRFHNYALEAFTKSNRIYVIGKEIRQRIKTIFPELVKSEDKIVNLHLGVNTSLFQPVKQMDRFTHILKLCKKINTKSQGKTAEMSKRLREDLFPGITQSHLADLIEQNSDYHHKEMDHNLDSRLKSVNWTKDRILLFVGRLISSKGIHSIIAALPGILEKNPQLKLIVVGHGPLREPMEAFLWALEKGSPELALKIVKWGCKLEGSGNQPLIAVQAYFSKLEKDGQLEQYFDIARRHVSPKNIIFTGYLNHQELCYLFPASDVAVFPSIVIEAGPLVFLEAMASGCFPLGTYFGGMAASIDSVAGSIPKNILDCMKLTADQDGLVQDIIIKTTRALNIENRYKKILRKIAVEKYDWQNISLRLATDLLNLKNGKG